MPIHEVVRLDVQARGDEAADVKTGGGGEEDAVGVDQDHPTVSVNTAGDGGAVVA